MTSPSRALLPSGFYDLLPPDAEQEAHLVRSAMECFGSYGYSHVRPPLVEFEDTLLPEREQAIDRQTFRLMDPLTQRPMGIRADMTMQIGRIALSRMADAPWPRRLCYHGTILRTRADALQPARQLMQAGAELIGEDTEAADVEAIVVAIDTLERMGVRRLAVDINVPALLRDLLDAESSLTPADRQQWLMQLVHKDTGGLEALPARLAELLRRLVDASSSGEESVKKLQQLEFDLPDSIRIQLQRLIRVAEKVHAACPDCQITLDLTENRGFEYHQGISFALFATGIEGEIGRGGRYLTAFDGKTPAIGFTIYISHLLPILPKPPLPKQLAVASGLDYAVMRRLQHEGWHLCRLNTTSEADLKTQAKNHACHSYYWQDTLYPLSIQN